MTTVVCQKAFAKGVVKTEQKKGKSKGNFIEIGTQKMAKGTEVGNCGKEMIVCLLASTPGSGYLRVEAGFGFIALYATTMSLLRPCAV